MTTWRKVQGDVHDTLTVTLAGITDLTTATSVAVHVTPRGSTTATTLTAAVTTPATNLITVQLGTWLETAEPGPWRLETQVTFADGSVLTWPAQGTDSIEVRAQLA